MKRNHFCVLVCVVFAWLQVHVSMAFASETRPNVIVILTDDQGWGDLSLHGNRNLETPTLDGLAKAGARFDRFFVCPVCSPTRAEFLTGRYAARGGVYSTSAGGERFDSDLVTIADDFKTAGYRTAAFGKWHNGSQYPYHPCGRGFDTFYGFCSGHWGNYFSPMLESNGRVVAGNGFLPNELTGRAMDVIVEHAETENADPFFLYLAYNTPHSPMQVPDRFYKKFDGLELLDRGTDAKRENVAHTRAALAMCENVDWNVGRLLEKLDEHELADDTIVVFFCDNGPNGHRFNGAMRGTKGSTDEGGVRSPLFIRWPGKIQPDLKVDSIAGAIDLRSTLGELAGVSRAAKMFVEGVSWADVLLGKEQDPRIAEAIGKRKLFSYWDGRLSVRNQDFRLDEKGRLYDMVADPGQLNAINDQHPEVAAELKLAADQWLQSVKPVDRNNVVKRPFPVGHKDFAITQLPARDAKVIRRAGGEPDLQRSNRYPNDSYFRNWSSTDDALVWPIEILDSGNFAATIYYACDDGDQGCELALVAADSIGGAALKFKIENGHEVSEKGAEHDRVPRQESYVKDFKAVNVGRIQLQQGVGQLQLNAEKIVGKKAIEFRLLVLERVNGKPN